MLGGPPGYWGGDVTGDVGILGDVGIGDVGIGDVGIGDVGIGAAMLSPTFEVSLLRNFGSAVSSLYL